MYDLSICIPSFDRYYFLLKTLENIQICLNGTNKVSVEVVVVDNSSSDVRYLSLPEICSEMTCKVTIVRNNSNIGLSKNILKCFKEASDDDDLLITSFDFLSGLFAKEPLSVYLRAGIKGESSIAEVHTITNKVDLIGLFSCYSMLGFISSNIYHSDMVKNYDLGSRYSSTLFPHVAMYFNFISQSNLLERPILISDSDAGPMISWRENNRSYSDLYVDAIVGMLSLSEVLPTNLSQNFLDKAFFDFSRTHYTPLYFKDYRVRNAIYKFYGFRGVAVVISNAPFYFLKMFVKKIIKV